MKDRISSRRRKTLRHCGYSIIIVIIIVLVFILVLMCFPLYADEIGYQNSFEYYETIVVDGVETKYQLYDTINMDNIAYSFIKGELFEVREYFNVYSWSLDINQKYEYFFFEYTGPIRELKDTGENKDNEDVSSGAATTQAKTEVSPITTSHSHSYSEWVTVVEATCLKEGSRVRVCLCGEKETEVIKKLSHSWLKKLRPLLAEFETKKPGLSGFFVICSLYY